MTVLACTAPGLPKERTEEGMRVRRVLRPVALGPLWGVSYTLQALREILRERSRTAFVLCHQLYLHSIAAAVAGRLTGIPTASLLVNAGATGDVKRLRRHRFGRLLTRLALGTSGVFVLSDEGERELEGSVPAARVHRHRYFVDTNRFAPNGDAARAFDLVYVGRLAAQKRVALLCRTVERTGLSLLVVGDGEERDAVERIAKRCDRIAFEPWTDAPQEALHRARAFVSFSRGEGLSNAMLEAMACGLPVLATDVSGVREALGVGNDNAHAWSAAEAGVTLPAGDPAKALAEAWQWANADPARLQRMGAAARKRVEERYSEDVAVRLFLRGVRRMGAARR